VILLFAFVFCVYRFNIGIDLAAIAIKLFVKADIVYSPKIPPLMISDSIDAAVIESFLALRDRRLRKYDFSAFMAQGSTVQSTVRNVKYATVERVGNVIRFKVAADGFLYNMVRIIVGTLLRVGSGMIEPDEIPEILEAKDRGRAGETARPHGLTLVEIKYPEAECLR
jgi:hypothetical protein